MVIILSPFDFKKVFEQNDSRKENVLISIIFMIDKLNTAKADVTQLLSVFL